MTNSWKHLFYIRYKKINDSHTQLKQFLRVDAKGSGDFKNMKKRKNDWVINANEILSNYYFQLIRLKCVRCVVKLSLWRVLSNKNSKRGKERNLKYI